MWYVHGCELARKSWEGINDFRLYNGLINNVQARLTFLI